MSIYDAQATCDSEFWIISAPRINLYVVAFVYFDGTPAQPYSRSIQGLEHLQDTSSLLRTVRCQQTITAPDEYWLLFPLSLIVSRLIYYSGLSKELRYERWSRCNTPPTIWEYWPSQSITRSWSNPILDLFVDFLVGYAIPRQHPRVLCISVRCSGPSSSRFRQSLPQFATHYRRLCFKAVEWLDILFQTVTSRLLN